MIFGTSANRIAAFLALTLAMTACNRMQPIYNVQDHPIPQIAKKTLSEDQIGDAIIRAAGIIGWRVDLIKPGLYRATISWQGHSATADVHYSTQNFGIILDNSVNLKEKNGEIHRRYNQYVQQLEDEIDRQLYRAAI